MAIFRLGLEDRLGRTHVQLLSAEIFYRRIKALEAIKWTPNYI